MDVLYKCVLCTEQRRFQCLTFLTKDCCESCHCHDTVSMGQRGHVLSGEAAYFCVHTPPPHQEKIRDGEFYKWKNIVSYEFVIVITLCIKGLKE
jgi:hypothetical protein